VLLNSVSNVFSFTFSDYFHCFSLQIRNTWNHKTPGPKIKDCPFKTMAEKRKAFYATESAAKEARLVAPAEKEL
jgi:hypothetical protein